MANKYTYLKSSNAAFSSMLGRFGIVTVMNANIYDVIDNIPDNTIEGFIAAYEQETPIAHLDTLKVANVTLDGPTKTITGGQYANPLIKYGKTARLEMQDALGNAEALDALCGTVTEYTGTGTNYNNIIKKPDDARVALHVGTNFQGEKCIIGDSFFIDQKSGQQVKVKIIFYKFLPDSLFNLTQDAEGDATVFDMNGDLLAVDVIVGNTEGGSITQSMFYGIVSADLNSGFNLKVDAVAKTAEFTDYGTNTIKVKKPGSTFEDYSTELTNLTEGQYEYLVQDKDGIDLVHSFFTI